VIFSSATFGLDDQPDTAWQKDFATADEAGMIQLSLRLWRSMAKLSVNINKIATLRNTRDNNIPDILYVARLALLAGAHGITIHPRPDERHVRGADVEPIAALLRRWPDREFNIEGNPFHGLYIEHCISVRPTQATLVPDSLEQRTSDHGWDLAREAGRLRPVIHQLKSVGCRVSLFVDHVAEDFAIAREIGADRVELYTEPYAVRHARGDRRVAAEFADAARRASGAGLGVNAGHDLNLFNLSDLIRAAPQIAEVSIGHALTADALEFGMAETVRRYLKAAEVD
jgi:pyridoxine 5-phosphate synthase